MYSSILANVSNLVFISAKFIIYMLYILHYKLMKILMETFTLKLSVYLVYSLISDLYTTRIWF